MESNIIPNHYAKLSKGKKDTSVNPKTDMKKLTRIVILGPSNAGKNNFLYDWIKRSPNIYKELHVICRNRDQPLYDDIAEKLGDAAIFYDADSVPTVDEIGKDEDGGMKLVVIDDFSNDENLQKKVFADYFVRGRHHKITTIFITHSYYKGCNKMIRLNSDYIIILKANSKNDLKMIVKDFNIPGIDEHNIMDHYAECTKDKGQTMIIDNVCGKLKHNYKRVLN